MFHLGKNILICIVGVLIILSPTGSNADIIYLRGNEQIEGTIIKETDEEVFIDVGVGTISFNKSEIEKVKKKSGEATAEGKKVITLPSTYIERLFTQVRTLKEKRREAMQGKKDCRDLFKQFAFYNQRYLTYTRVLDDLHIKLQERHAVGDLTKYNSLVIQMNTFRAKRVNLIIEAQKTFEERISKEKSLFNTIQDIFSLQYRFNEKFLDIKEKHIAQEDKYYYKELEKEAQHFTQDFKLLEVPYTEIEQGTLVKVLLNNTITASFIIDVNVPITMISREVALILNVSNYMPLGTIDFSHINIPLGEAEPAFLDSIQMDKVRMNNVTTLIMNTLPYYGVDGVLGISFFKHCIIRIDEKKKQLILYEFIPS